MKYESGNSQLLIDYRASLLKTYELGEDIKKVYGIVPPAILHVDGPTLRVSLNVH